MGMGVNAMLCWSMIYNMGLSFYKKLLERKRKGKQSVDAPHCFYIIKRSGEKQVL